MVIIMLCIYLLPILAIHLIKYVYMSPLKKNGELFKYFVFGCLINLLIIKGVISESSRSKKVYVYSREEQNVTLPLPEHLMDQVEDIFWMKDFVNHIATTFINGSLRILDSRYEGRLQISSDGSLIICDLRIEDRGQYSADIHLMNKGLYTKIYYVGVYRKSYYISLGTKYVIAEKGEDVILQNNLEKIKSIDWLTQQWNKFAVTNLDGQINILNQKYSGRLSSLKDGSIILKAVTKEDEGTYRAYVFSHNGTILVQKYNVSIHGVRLHDTRFINFALILPLLLFFLVWLHKMIKKKRNVSGIRVPESVEIHQHNKKEDIADAACTLKVEKRDL